MQQAYCGRQREWRKVYAECVCMLMCLIKGVEDHAPALSSSSRLTQIWPQAMVYLSLKGYMHAHNMLIDKHKSSHPQNADVFKETYNSHANSVSPELFSKHSLFLTLFSSLSQNVWPMTRQIRDPRKIHCKRQGWINLSVDMLYPLICRRHMSCRCNTEL